MSAPGPCANSVHQHLGLYQLIVSRWCLSSELVFKAFKVTFIKFPWGQERNHLSCRQNSVTNSLVCCSIAKCFAKSRQPLSKMVWFLWTHQHLAPCGVGKGGHWFVVDCPALTEGRYVHERTHEEKTGSSEHRFSTCSCWVTGNNPSDQCCDSVSDPSSAEVKAMILPKHQAES